MVCKWYVSGLLFVMILAARFWSFCSLLMSVDPAQPQTEQSKVGLNNTSVKGFQTSHRQKGSVSQKADCQRDLGRNCLNLLFPV